MGFVKVGNRLVNLAHVREIHLNSDGTAEVQRVGVPGVLAATAEETRAILNAISPAAQVAPAKVVGLKEPAPK